MIGQIRTIDFTRFEYALPAFLTIVAMPFTYSRSPTASASGSSAGWSWRPPAARAKSTPSSGGGRGLSFARPRADPGIAHLIKRVRSKSRCRWRDGSAPAATARRAQQSGDDARTRPAAARSRASTPPRYRLPRAAMSQLISPLVPAAVSSRATSAVPSMCRRKRPPRHRRIIDDEHGVEIGGVGPRGQGGGHVEDRDPQGVAATSHRHPRRSVNLNGSGSPTSSARRRRHQVQRRQHAPQLGVGLGVTATTSSIRATGASRRRRPNRAGRSA